jgi:hypothetical protein
MIYCILNRSGSEDTECYQPVAECPVVCQGVTGFCSAEYNQLLECRLKAGACLLCYERNGELHPYVDAIEGVCGEESARVDGGLPLSPLHFTQCCIALTAFVF